jgi:hypothetical protein
MFLNLAVQAIQIGAYAARLAGVQSGRIATSISLFNLFVTASRLMNLLYAPMLGILSDRVGNVVAGSLAGDALAKYTLGDVVSGGAPAARAAAAVATAHFEWQIRLIVLAGTVGTALGAALLPTFILLFMRGIRSFERLGSVPAALLRLTDPRVLAEVVRTVRFPPPRTLRRFPLGAVPGRLLVFNVVVTAIYAIGVVAASYASILDPAFARTSLLLSGLINGIATVSFTLIVDPTSSYITDQAVRGERTLDDVKAMVFWLSVTAIAGTLLSQLILDPAAYVIARAAHLVNAHQAVTAR